MAVQDRVARRRLSARLRVAWPALIALVASTAVCNREFEGLEPDVYVEVMARLSHASARFFNATRVDSARAVVLEEFGVSGDDLVAFSERYGDDPAFMTELWQRIQIRFDSLQAELERDTASVSAGRSP